MEIKNRLVLPIVEITQVAEARRLATTLAHNLGLSETVNGKVALVVTECATNLVKHTPHGGELLISAVAWDRRTGIEILALDKGPGIANVAEALRDGFSTAGSLGTGLGAIARLSDVFDIYSLRGVGTAVLARLWARPVTKDQPLQSLDIGVVSLPKPGELVCGDAWAVGREAVKTRVLVADGLGHGIGAAEAANAAVQAFQRSSRLTLLETVQGIHQALRQTRGVVLGLAEIDFVDHVLRFTGIGNIEGAIYMPDRVDHLVSGNGTAGYEIGRIKELTYPYPEGTILVINSDGCTSQLSLHPYVGLSRKPAALIAGVLYRDFNRGRDDVTVLVIKRALTQA
jgi:anti-sigma regulatory factor (Ser/Thr protein kinase)